MYISKIVVFMLYTTALGEALLGGSSFLYRFLTVETVLSHGWLFLACWAAVLYAQKLFRGVCCNQCCGCVCVWEQI